MPNAVVHNLRMEAISMRRTRFPWYLCVAIVVTALLSISTTAGAASTTGATLHASGETVIVNKRNETRFIPSNIENGGSEDFVGSGFGPCEYQVGKAILGDAALYQIAYPAGVDGRIPVGRQYFSARGDSTQRTASTPFDLVSSQVDS